MGDVNCEGQVIVCSYAGCGVYWTDTGHHKGESVDIQSQKGGRRNVGSACMGGVQLHKGIGTKRGRGLDTSFNGDSTAYSNGL